jgi:succinate dehydrogenase/fumarate reductase flavoprotein subunit
VAYANRTEWNKCFVSFASDKEVRGGKGSPAGGIYFALGHVPWKDFEAKAMISFPNWRYKALDLSEVARRLKNHEALEVGPAVEYFDGGILINERFETGVEGLFAAGECTLGPFGANRVHSAITEMLVHGAEAGRNAADYAEKAKVPPADQLILKNLEEKAQRPLAKKAGLKPPQVRRHIQEMAHRHLGPIRHHGELTAFIHFLEEVKKDVLPNLATTTKSKIYNKEWIDAIELENIIHLLEAAARSALFRTESRGVHYREDYPQTDNDNWIHESIVKFEDGALTVNKRSATVTNLTPPSGVTPYLDMLKKMMEAHSQTGGHH